MQVSKIIIHASEKEREMPAFDSYSVHTHTHTEARMCGGGESEREIMWL